MPDSRMATISSEVATGRSMNSRDGFIRQTPPAPSPARLLALFAIAAAFFARRIAAFARRGRIPGRQLDLRAFAQTVHAVDYDQFAGPAARLDDGRIAFGRSRFYVAQRDRAIVFDDVDEKTARAALQRRARHHRYVAPCIDQHAHVDELVG